MLLIGIEPIVANLIFFVIPYLFNVMTSTTYCAYCEKETNNPKYCSRSCSAKANNKNPKRKKTKKCIICKCLINKRNSYCSDCYTKITHERSENLLNHTLEFYTNKEWLNNTHKSNFYSHIRSMCHIQHKDKKKLPCYLCGYDKHVELCHIKPISSFSANSTVKEINAEDNVIQLCRNCHWEFDHGLINKEEIVL